MNVLYSLILFLLLTNTILAEEVVINEFLIDPQPQQVELFNTGSESIDISGWYLDDSGGTTYFTIPANTVIYPQSCLVFSGDFNLNKSSSDTVRLFDTTSNPTMSNAELQDSFSYDKSQGVNISYLRSSDGENNWIHGSSSLGKSNVSGSSCIYLTPTNVLTPTMTEIVSPTSHNLQPTEDITPTPSISPIATESYTNIFINEVMPYPDTNQKEWIELYNNNNFAVTLTNWYIDDKEDSGGSPKVITLTISPYSYAIVEISSLLNNDEDEVRLLNFQNKELDRTAYIDPIQNKSWGKNSNGFCYQESTKGTKNNECITTALATVVVTPTITQSFVPDSYIFSYNLTSTAPAQLLEPTISPNITPNIDINFSYVESIPTPKQQVLGSHVRHIPLSPFRSIISSLSFASFSFSVLNIVSIVLKVKTMA